MVHRFGSYELHEPVDDYAVWVLGHIARRLEELYVKAAA